MEMKTEKAIKILQALIGINVGAIIRFKRKRLDDATQKAAIQILIDDNEALKLAIKALKDKNDDRRQTNGTSTQRHATAKRKTSTHGT
jgi:hypothetical protein